MDNGQSPHQQGRVWKPSPLTLSEKLEFLYLSPYYLQAACFLLGTLSWLLSETIFKARLPFWTNVWGWSLVLTNFLSLPLMNLVGLFLEEAEERDYLGILSFVALSYILVPFQAYAAVRGFLENEEGPWFRTPKTGRITDILTRGKLYRLIVGMFPGKREHAVIPQGGVHYRLNPYLALNTANNRFDEPVVEMVSIFGGLFDGFIHFHFLGRKTFRFAKRHLFTKTVLASFLAIIMFVNYMAFFVVDRQPPRKDSIGISKGNLRESLTDEYQFVDGVSAASGQTITSFPRANTNLQENPNAIAMEVKKGDVLAAEQVEGGHLSLSEVNLSESTNEIYRWSTKTAKGTTYSFGLQDAMGIWPVVKVKNKQGWFIRFEDNSLLDVGGNRNSVDYVSPRVNENTIEWDLTSGVTARYSVLADRVKADYIVNSQLSIPNSKLDFLVHYNDEYSGDVGEEVVNGKGYLTHVLTPEGEIDWLGENNATYFANPIPVIKDGQGKELSGSYTIHKISQGNSIISINIPQEVLDSARFPLSVDPSTIDSTAVAENVGFAGGRKLSRDAWGNLILACDCGVGDDNIYYKQYNSVDWTDANIDLNDTGTTAAEELAFDLAINTAAELHISYVDVGDEDLKYRSFNINYNANNTISSISDVTTEFAIDTSGSNQVDVAQPSLVIANKGEGAVREKVTLSWEAASNLGGTRAGEIRFLQCDVSDGCDVASEWKNASEERSGTMPSGIDAPGSADVLFETTGTHTFYHDTHIQVPGRPSRTPTHAKRDDNGTFTDLSSALDDNVSTTSPVNSLDTSDYIYIGDDTTFSRVVVNIGNTAGDENSSAALFDCTSPSVCEYCSAASGSCTTWSSLANLVDNTSTSTVAFNEDGSILFDEPSGWVTATVDGVPTKYWIRLRPDATFDATVNIAEFEVTDRHSKDLMIVAGEDISHDLGTAYVIWNDVDQDRWENIPGNSTVPAPWRQTTDTLSPDGAYWAIHTNFPLAIAADVINNNVFVSYLCEDNGVSGTCISGSLGDELRVVRAPNTLSLTVAGNWSNTSFPSVTEADDVVMTLTSDQNDIYLIYVLDPEGTGNAEDLVWARCNPAGGGVGNLCDVAADWPTTPPSGTLDNGTALSHPMAITSKAFGDTIAIDVVYSFITGAETGEVRYERHFVDMANQTIIANATDDDAFHRDCVSGTDDQDTTGTTLTLGRDDADASCVSADSENHAGFRFPSVTVTQGAAISSAYVDFRVASVTGSGAMSFTIYAEDVDSAVTNGTGFDSLTDIDGANVNLINNLTKTQTSSSQSITFSGTPNQTNSFRFDVTDMVQEIVCRGAANAQPCVGNYNGAGSWASGNAIAILFISNVGEIAADRFITIEAQDAGGQTMLDATLQINLGNTRRNYSIGVTSAPSGAGTTSDLDHPMESAEFTAVNTDDSSYVSASASLTASNYSSANPVFMFKANNDRNNNTDDIQISVIVKSSIPTRSYGGLHTAGRTIYLQVYRDGATDDWVTQASDTTTAPDTDITFNVTISNLPATQWEFYGGETPGGSACNSADQTGNTNCWSRWRVYQDAAPEANQILYVDFVSFTFVPEKVLWLLPLALFLPRILPKLFPWFIRKKEDYAVFQPSS